MLVKSLKRFENKLIPTSGKCIHDGKALNDYSDEVLTKCNHCDQPIQTGWIVYTCSKDGCDYWCVTKNGQDFYRLQKI